VHEGDLTSATPSLAAFADGADVLYHCAAEIHDPQRMMDVNVDGTRRLVEAAAGRVRRWVQLSSIAVYGAPERGVITEETPPQPVDVYGRSKAEADALVQAAVARGSFSGSILRPTKVFGAGLDGGNNAVLYRLFSAIDRGLFFFIGMPGAMTHYVHVDDVIDALRRCAGAEASGIYNLSDDCTIEEFVAVIAAALEKPMPRRRIPEPLARGLARVAGRIPGVPLDEKRVAAMVNRARVARERIERELGFAPVVPVAQGLRELVRAWHASR